MICSDVSRIITGKLRLDARPVDLAPVIKAAIDIVRLAADAKGIGIEFVFDPRIGSISGDADRLQQVFWNLLSNAIKFTPHGGRVAVRLLRADRYVIAHLNPYNSAHSPAFLISCLSFLHRRLA